MDNTKAEPTIRIWLDSTASNAVEARLVSSMGDRVELEKPDRTKLSLSIDRLSPADQRYLTERVAPKQKTSSQSDLDSLPNVVAALTAITLERLPDSPRRSTRKSNTDEIWSSNDFDAPDVYWVLPLLASDQWLLVTGNFGGSEKTGDPEDWRSVLFDANRGVAVSQVRWPSMVNIHSYDALEDRMLVGLDVNSEDHSKYLVAMSGLRSGKLESIAYLDATYRRRSVTKNRRKGERSAPSLRFTAAEMIGDQILAIRDRILFATKLGASAPIWEVTVPKADTFALSPNRKFFAIPDINGMKVLDSTTGRVIRQLATEDNDFRRAITFSPDQRKLACQHGDRVEIWDLNSAIRVSDQVIDAGDRKIRRFTCRWLDSSNLLINSTWLYNQPLNQVVWIYDEAFWVQTPHGLGRLFRIDDKTHRLVAHPFPHAAAREKLAKMNAEARDGTLTVPKTLLDKLTTVNLLIDAIPAHYEKIETAVKLAMERAGCKEDRKSEVTFIARLKPAEHEVDVKISFYRIEAFGPQLPFPDAMRKEYELRGIPLPDQRKTDSSKAAIEIRVHPTIIEYEIQLGKEVIWKRTYTPTNGYTLNLNEKTIDSDIQQLAIRPDPRELAWLALPSQILAQPPQGPLPQSRLMIDRIEDH